MVWFMQRALTFAGHADPIGLALRLQPRLKENSQGTETFALFKDGQAVAGATARVEAVGEGVSRLTLAPIWHNGTPAEFSELLQNLLTRYQHDVARLPLHLLPEASRAELAALVEPLGFLRGEQLKLRFELSEVPPLGVPLVLEAYREPEDRLFRNVHEASEGVRVTDVRWSYLKRAEGPFRPDLWLLARETLDQDPVGYAFCGLRRPGIDATYYLTGVGVLQKHRNDSEMLRRLVVSLLHELSIRSPFGALEVVLPSSDPKLAEILGYVGFEELEREPLLLKLPS